MNSNPQPISRKGIVQIKWTSTMTSFLVLIVIWIATSFFIDGFATKDYFIQTLQTASFLGILAAGQTIVILMAGIDLSVSSVITLSSVITSYMIANSGYGAVTAIIAGLLVSAIIGLINAFGVSFLRLSPLIMSIAMISIIEGGMLIFTNGTPPSGMSPTLVNLSKSTWFLGLPNSVFLWIVVSLFTYWFLHISKYGRQIISIGTNEKASILSGINVTKMKFFAYTLCSLFAGLSGILMLGYMGSTYLTLGTPYQLLSIAAVVLGGTSVLGGKGNYLGTIAGTLLLIVLQNILRVIDIPVAGREVIMGALILVILFAYARERKQGS